MSEIKFSCPSCEQHLEADQSYAGTQIACPTCQIPFTIPDNIIVAAAPPPVRATAPALAVASPSPRLAPSAPQQEGLACPSCGAGMARGAVLCVQCGYNLSTKKRMVAGQAVAPGRPSSDQWETPWYQTAYPYLGALLLVLGLLYFWGQTNPRAMAGFIGVGAVYSLVMHVVVVIAAFKEGSGTGMLALCLPFYALYFVFKDDNPTLKLLYTVAIVVNICIRFLAKD